MASISDYVLDAALSKLDTEANAIHITSQEATTYTEATSTSSGYSLGSATSISIGAPQDRMVNSAADGREVVLANVTGGNVSTNGTADTFAIVDTTNNRLLATGALASSQTVTSGNTFTLTGISIGIPDPT